MKKHPIQPIELDEGNQLRFKPNPIVRHLLDHGGIDMHMLAMIEFDAADREQFAQLIGYSLDGFSTLSYASEETVKAASYMAETGATEEQARIATLEETLTEVRKGLKDAAVAAFKIHPDDLTT